MALHCSAREYKTVPSVDVQDAMGYLRAVQVGHKVFVFTGRPVQSYWRNVFVLDTKRKAWSCVTPSRETTAHESLRVKGAALVLVNDKIYSIGGASKYAFVSGSFYNISKVFELDTVLSTWKRVRTEGTAMEPCALHLACFVEKLQAIAVLDLSRRDSNKCYWIDTERFNCSIMVTKGNIPDPIKFASGCCAATKAFVFGVLRRSYGRLYVLDLAKAVPTWSTLGSYMFRSRARLWKCEGFMFIFGGSHASAEDGTFRMVCEAVDLRTGSSAEVDFSGSVEPDGLKKYSCHVPLGTRELLMFSTRSKADALRLRCSQVQRT